MDNTCRQGGPPRAVVPLGLGQHCPRTAPTRVCLPEGLWYNVLEECSQLPFKMPLHSLCYILGAFHLVRTHLGGEGGFKSPIHFHCVLHAKRGGGGPDSM